MHWGLVWMHKTKILNASELHFRCIENVIFMQKPYGLLHIIQKV